MTFQSLVNGSMIPAKKGFSSVEKVNNLTNASLLKRLATFRALLVCVPLHASGTGPFYPMPRTQQRMALRSELLPGKIRKHAAARGRLEIQARVNETCSGKYSSGAARGRHCPGDSGSKSPNPDQ